MYQPIKPNHRRARRCNILWAAAVAHGDVTKPCTITDLSETGARLDLIGPIPKGTRIKLICERFGELHGVVMWCNGLTAGLRFNLGTAEVARLLSPIVPGMGRRQTAIPPHAIPARPLFGRKARAA